MTGIIRTISFSGDRTDKEITWQQYKYQWLWHTSKAIATSAFDWVTTAVVLSTAVVVVHPGPNSILQESWDSNVAPFFAVPEGWGEASAEEAATSAAQGTFPIPGRSMADTTSEFGPRTQQKTLDGGLTTANHKGHDFQCAIGEPMVATVPGTVRYYNDDPAGWGSGAFYIEEESGRIHVYAHGDRLTADGAVVKEGDLVGTCGQNGSSTGPHLHYEIRENGIDSEPINPKDFLESLENNIVTEE